MKKKKASLKKLSLNKDVISNLENNQVAGGAQISGFVCPIVTRFNCPIFTPACPIELTPGCPILTPACPIESRYVCTDVGCLSDFIC
ncbi:class I lanthipeptide [Kordia jejudonensis]|uniref:class I lanthipeptide n=1 Tax=Kordia jejudonensis TaxID=1348245 RepID=UPI00062990AE|nr:class I lanthipeptide [Kordia jejudonensis]